MKKLLLSISILFLYAGANQVFAQESKTTTPANNSPVRKAIIAAVKKKFRETQKNIENPDLLKVSGSWARIVYDVKTGGDEGSTGVNLLLRKTSGAWKIVFDYSAGDGEDPDDYFKGIPRDIYNPWKN